MKPSESVAKVTEFELSQWNLKILAAYRNEEKSERKSEHRVQL